MANEQAVTSYSFIFPLLEDPKSNSNGEFVGFLNLCSDIVRHLTILVNAELCAASVDLYQDNKKVTSTAIEQIEDKHYSFGCKITLSACWERGGYYIGNNWDGLLKSTERILIPVKQAFFTDTNELATDDKQTYQNYLNLSKVCRIIDKVALPNNSNTHRTIIFERDISVFYTLKKSDLEHELNADAIERLLREDIHHEAKIALVREALVKFLKDKGSKQRFGYLISHFNAFSSDLLLSYQSFVEQYSFDKVRKEYQEKQTEYIQKINNVYSDVGAKVLAIPAGLWLAIFKLDEAEIGSFGFIKNIIILILCILCMIYAIFHFTAQFSVLKSLKDEYQALFKRLAAEHEEESDSINTAKTNIDKSAFWAWWKLTLSNFATAVVFIMVIVLGGYSL